MIRADITENDGLVGPAAGNLDAVLDPGAGGHLQETDGRDRRGVVVEGLHEAVLPTGVENVD